MSKTTRTDGIPTLDEARERIAAAGGLKLAEMTRDFGGIEPEVAGRNQRKQCRCGPEGCSDSVACPRGER